MLSLQEPIITVSQYHSSFRLDYINKMKDILKDKETYEQLIRNDPLRKLTNDIRSLLSRWKTKGYISNTTYNSIYCSDGNIPRAYGLPKVHKPGFNYRIIIVPVWRCEEHCLVWMTFQDVAFDGPLTGWSEAGSSDPSKGNRLDLEVLRASSKTLFSMFVNQIFEISKTVKYVIKT